MIMCDRVHLTVDNDNNASCDELSHQLFPPTLPHTCEVHAEMPRGRRE